MVKSSMILASHMPVRLLSIFVVVLFSVELASANPVLEFYSSFASFKSIVTPCHEFVREMKESEARGYSFNQYIQQEIPGQVGGFSRDSVERSIEDIVKYCNICQNDPLGFAIVNVLRYKDQASSKCLYNASGPTNNYNQNNSFSTMQNGSGINNQVHQSVENTRRKRSVSAPNLNSNMRNNGLRIIE